MKFNPNARKLKQIISMKLNFIMQKSTMSGTINLECSKTEVEPIFFEIKYSYLGNSKRQIWWNSI